jgi:hypothetical protein
MCNVKNPSRGVYKALTCIDRYIPPHLIESGVYEDFASTSFMCIITKDDLPMEVVIIYAVEYYLLFIEKLE